MLMVSGDATSRMLPVLAEQYDWQGAYLAADLAARGVADIPGYSYAQDGGASYDALLQFATSVVRAFYGGRGRGRFGPAATIAKDKQLQAGAGGGVLPGEGAARCSCLFAMLTVGGSAGISPRDGRPGPPTPRARRASCALWAPAARAR